MNIFGCHDIDGVLHTRAHIFDLKIWVVILSNLLEGYAISD